MTQHFSQGFTQSGASQQMSQSGLSQGMSQQMSQLSQGFSQQFSEGLKSDRNTIIMKFIFTILIIHIMLSFKFNPTIARALGLVWMAK